MNFEDYLKQKHLEHCNSVGYIVTVSDWVNEVLNQKLSKGDKLAYVSMNQWMNGDRMPDAKNIIRLIQVFGPEVIPYVGIMLPDDLASIISDWNNIPDETKKEMLKLVKKDRESATIVA